MEKFLYFRAESTLANDDGIEDSVTYPLEALIGMYPTSDVALTMTFKNVQRPEGHATSNLTDNAANGPLVDKVVLTIGTNKAKEVMEAIVENINNNHSNGFIVVADDTASVYITSDVTACTITHNAAYINA